MFYKKGVLKNLANFIGKHLCWSLFLIKLQSWRSGILSKRDSNTFLGNLLNFKKTYFVEHLRTNTPGFPSQGFFISMNVFDFLKCFTLGNIPCNTLWTMHLHYMWFSWQGKKQFSTTTKINWIKILFYNSASLAHSYM